MNQIKVVIFDCDGVMFDSTQANKMYYNGILKHFGRPEMTSDQFAYTHMHTVKEAMAHLFDDENSLKSAEAYRHKIGYHPFIRYMEIEPDLKPLIKRLKPKYRTAIATNRSDTMPGVLAEHGLNGYFDMVVTSLDVTHPKPHPEQLLKILSAFNLRSANAIYIGDSELDEKAANAIEMPFVAYNNTVLSADFHIQRLKDLDKILLLSAD